MAETVARAQNRGTGSLPAMKRFSILIVALALVAAACGDDDSGESATTAAPETTATTAAETTTTAAEETTTTVAEETTTTAAAGGGAVFEITGIDLVAGTVEITNRGDAAGNLDGHWLCQRPSYRPLEAADLAPGEAVTVPMDVGGVDPANGELGLYSSNSFGSASAIVSYVEWGSSSGHGRSDTAVEAGVWDAGGFVATDAASVFIVRATDEVGSAAWIVATS